MFNGNMNFNNSMGNMNMYNNMNMNNNMNMCNNMNMNNMNMNMNNMNMNNNMNMALFAQMCNMNQMMGQIMQNFQNMQNNQNIQNPQNIQNCNNSGGNLDFRNLKVECYDPFYGNSQTRKNVKFIQTTGKIFVVSAPINITVRELIDGFFKKVGILNKSLQKQVGFIFNGRSLKDTKSKELINELISEAGINDGSKILVVDQGEVLGA